ncbi:MAG: hypothetical protein U5K31_10090 [Balneolaceae bacterium]|nr:hypothetical protein [Balneolaceae bacterium]
MSDRAKNIVWILAIALLAAGYLLYRVYSPDSSASSSAGPAERIEASEADQYVGSSVEVCGEVSSANYLSQVDGAPTFLNLGRAYPNQTFTAVIWGEDRTRWASAPERQYENRKICVTGMVEMHEGIPQIIVDRPQQIVVP